MNPAPRRGARVYPAPLNKKKGFIKRYGVKIPLVGLKSQYEEIKEEIQEAINKVLDSTTVFCLGLVLWN